MNPEMSQPHPDSPPVLRPAEERDEPFLYGLYTQHRAAELGAPAWPGPMLAAFLRSQYETRKRSHDGLPGLQRWIVAFHGIDAGTIAVSRTDGWLHVVDIALVSDMRNQGVGTRLLASVIAEAEESGRSVSLSVEKGQPRRSAVWEAGIRGGG